MSGHDGMRERKCGCITYDHGPPLVCKTHQTKQRIHEERSVRKAATQQAEELGHDLSHFREYQSQPGKWTAFCKACGALVIVYDTVPKDMDQIAGAAIVNPCRKSALITMLQGTHDGD